MLFFSARPFLSQDSLIRSYPFSHNKANKSWNYLIKKLIIFLKSLTASCPHLITHFISNSWKFEHSFNIYTSNM